MSMGGGYAGRARTVRLLGVAVLFAVLCACRSAPFAVPLLEQVEQVEQVEQMQQRRFAAMVAQDMGALEPMLADELTYVHSTGQAENRLQFVKTIRSGKLRYLALETTHPVVRRHAQLVLLTGAAWARVQPAGGAVQELQLRYTDVYIWRDGRWQLVAWQSTRVP